MADSPDTPGDLLPEPESRADLPSPAEPLFADRDRYCIECGYNLRGVTRPVCPECGRSFDPKRLSTYLNDPPAEPTLQRIGRRAGHRGTSLTIHLLALWMPSIVLWFGPDLHIPTFACMLLPPLVLLGAAAIYRVLQLLPEHIQENVALTLPVGFGTGALLGIPYGPIGMAVGAIVGPITGLILTRRALTT